MCIYIHSSLKRPAGVQSFLRCNNTLHNTRTFLVGCEKSRVDVVEVFLFGVSAFCLADAIYADRTVCKYAGNWVVRFSHGSGACVALSCDSECGHRPELRMAS